MAHNHRNNIISHPSIENHQLNGVEKRYNYIFNSNSGVLLREPNKALFNVSFTSTINFPDDATSIQIGLHSANIVNSVPNVKEGNYNKITFIVLDSGNQAIQKTITIPTGSYSACDLQKAINAGLAEEYLGFSPLPQITLLGNTATQKISIQFNEAGMQIDWGSVNPVDSVGFILGFDEPITQPISGPSTKGQVIEAQVAARFNWAITNFLIICNELVGDGLPLNNVGFGVIGAVPILAAPGSLIAYEARQILWIQCDQLCGQNLSSLTFELANERGELVDIIDDYNFTVVIKTVY